MIRVGRFGPEQPYPDYFPTDANKKIKQSYSFLQLWKTVVLNQHHAVHPCEHEHMHSRFFFFLHFVTQAEPTHLPPKVIAEHMCGEIVKNAAHASVLLINLPLQVSQGIYILLMLRTPRDAHIFLSYTHVGMHALRHSTGGTYHHIAHGRKKKSWGCLPVSV